MELTGTQIAHSIAWNGVLLALLTGAFLLFLQIRTYRRIGHRSLLVAATGQVFGLVYGAFQVTTYFLQPNSPARWTLFYLASACLFVECIVGAIGALLIFRAFEQSVLRLRATPPPLLKVGG
ncbi:MULTISPECIES: hypothetical protein [unclassified Dyella]|uniref:hypothetical protein n=1 Tax=unclassified Dyella TaxID=2634549 RepID=UPI000C85020F|nr:MULTISPECIES: hypothetical protein [unclassified Dyella]MDR3447957.1 hypothetical protein [Dyella sp.]PMQ02560.1 hypothetical protein DyAD56_23645 [Dyella sp. AD56]